MGAWGYGWGEGVQHQSSVWV